MAVTGNLVGNYGAILNAYGDLGAQVQSQIQGIDTAQQNAINAAYAKQSGTLAQTMIQRGLGNTTVQNSEQRGLLQSQQQALSANKANFAQLMAGYTAQLGMAGLGAAGQFTGAQNQLGLGYAGLANQKDIATMNAANQMALARLNNDAMLRAASLRGAGGVGNSSASLDAQRARDSAERIAAMQAAGRGGGGAAPDPFALTGKEGTMSNTELPAAPSPYVNNPYAPRSGGTSPYAGYTPGTGAGGGSSGADTGLWGPLGSSGYGDTGGTQNFNPYVGEAGTGGEGYTGSYGDWGAPAETNPAGVAGVAGVAGDAGGGYNYTSYQAPSGDYGNTYGPDDSGYGGCGGYDDYSEYY